MKKTILPNGLTILTEERPSTKSVTLSMFVKAGSYHEKHYPKGIAHFVEHMLFKGTQTRTSKMLNEEMDFIGGIWNAYTDFEKTKYYCLVSDSFWKEGTNLLLDIIWNHTFPTDEVVKERNVIMEEIKMYQDDPEDLVLEKLNCILHPQQEERQSIIGTFLSVSSITREDLVRFVNEFYQPKNLVFVATGHLNHEELVQYIIDFGFSRDNKNEISPLSFVPSQHHAHSSMTFKDIQQAHIAWSIPTVDMLHSDVPVLHIIDSLLGSSSSSRLFDLLREEKGLCYSVYTFNDHKSDHGYFKGYVGLECQHVEEVKEMILVEFKRLQNEKVSDHELARYKNITKGVFVLRMEQNSAINEYLGLSHIFGLNDDLNTYIEEIDSVTSDDILRVANQYFHEDSFTFSHVLPHDYAENL